MYNVLGNIGKGLYNAVRSSIHFTLKGDLETLVGGLGWGLKLEGRELFLGLKAGLHTSEDDFLGVKLGLVNDTKHNGAGLEIGVENNSETVLGGQVGGKNYTHIALGVQGGLENHADSILGFQVGGKSTAKSAYGAQIGVSDYAEDLNGFQAGVVCEAGDGNYLQFGAITIRNEGPWYLRVTPLIGGHTNIKFIKNAQRFLLKRVVLPWAALYIMASYHTAFDYKLINASRIEQDQTNSLVVRRYKVMVDGHEKDLTLVGETHDYTKAEVEVARKLVDEHSVVAAELNIRRPAQSLGYRLYNKAVSELGKVQSKFEQYGSGRFYTHAPVVIAREKGLKVYSLEKDTFGPLSFSDRASHFASVAAGLLFAPLSYYGERFDFNSVENQCISPDDPNFKDPLVTKRNPEIAGNISKLIQREEIDDLLATTGRCHLDGVIIILEEELDMKEVVPEPKSGVDKKTKNIWEQQERRYSRGLESRMRAKTNTFRNTGRGF